MNGNHGTIADEGGKKVSVFGTRGESEFGLTGLWPRPRTCHELDRPYKPFQITCREMPFVLIHCAIMTSDRAYPEDNQMVIMA